ncbi:hypothetical protein HYV85_01070 [Candidatus Woesearchaeota archaeon]|nr:hypothetical protein [Candidatus Woesearchaeota archaeon]
MRKRAWQLFIVVVLLLFLQLFDYSLNKQQLPSAIPITGAITSDSQTATCAETSPCKSPTSWKCQSNSRCYDYSDCLFQCPYTPSSEKKEEKQPEQTCTCGDWQTIGGCGEQGCPSSEVPQSKSCTGGSACKTENRCVGSTQCKADQLPSQRCVDYSCIKDSQGLQYCSYKCTIDGKRYESSECEQKCVEAAVQLPQGVNLVPELLINPSERLKSGDSIEVTFYIKNTGAKAATQYDMKDKGTTLSNIVYFYKGKEYGPDAISPIYAPINILFLPDSTIKPREAGKVQLAKQTVKIPEDFSGDMVVAAVVDAQFSYPETNENDNRPTRTLSVRALTKPNLVISGFETSIRSFDVLPVAIGPVFVTVENKGETPATSAQLIENRVSIFKGDAEICRATAREQMVEGIEPGKPRKFALYPRFITADMAGNQCSVDDEATNYRAVVEIDAPQLGPQGNILAGGLIAESNEEDNKQTFTVKAREKCSPLGKVEAGQYCDISSGTWQNQKDSGRQCSHNFECKTDLCLGKESNSKKCISEEKKTKILEIVG